MRFFRPGHLMVLASLLLARAGEAQTPQTRALAPLADSTRQRVLEQVRAPEELEIEVFAAPPHVIYPVAIEAGAPGELFVAQDPNLNFDRARRRGRVVRLVDRDLDGTADAASVFADSLDSPRGMMFDGRTLYLAHAPTLSALRDTDGDGVADQSEVLIRGFGVGLEQRGGDHTINGITMGIDGWLYVAVGDYGFVKATGRDGTQLQLRGGGVVRVRPDGSEMEIYARGTRNIYDVAVDPFLNVFARDNNNNGQGWDVRLHYLPQGADVGWPALFRDFGDEILAPLAEYGAGAGTSAAWVHEPGFPSPYSSSLYTADWGLSKVFRHPLRPDGATFDAGQEEFLSIPRPADMVVGGEADLYVASLSGGAYTYAGDHVGYIVRLRHRRSAASPSLPAAGLSSRALADLIASPSADRRLDAQQELLRRGAVDDAVVRRLEQMVLDRATPDFARVAAIFTLKQLLGARSHPALLRAADDSVVRAAALRALADRKSQLVGVPTEPFVRGLADPDPRVRAQAITGLVRLAARDAAEAILPLTRDRDAVISHLAHTALVELDAVEPALRALDSSSPEVAAAALRVLRRIHSPVAVSALLERLEWERDTRRGVMILQALARLYHRDAIWTGDWWDVLPHTDGPFHEPAAWSESPRIRPALVRALADAESGALDELLREYLRHRVLPKGSDTLVRALARAHHPLHPQLVDALVGRVTLPASLAPTLTALRDQSPELREAVARVVVAQPGIADDIRPLVRAAALDARLPSELRVQALAALSRASGREGTIAAAEAFAAITPEVAGDTLLQVAWRRFAGDRRNAREVEYFAGLAETDAPRAGVLGYAVLVQIARTAQNPPEARSRASSAIESAWARPAAAAQLVAAIELVGAQSLYAEQLQEYRRRIAPG